jgi:glutaredoxin
MTEYIIGYILKGCPYSMMADEILKKNPINQIIYVDQSQKAIYKQQNKMDTFPQIFFIKNNKKFKIGGYDNLSKLLDKNNLIDRKELHKHICTNVPYKTFLNLLMYLHR